MGPQQEDPLGPLLFCLLLQPILLKLSGCLTLGYLEDLTLGEKESAVATDVKMI